VNGAPGDVFASADEATMRTVTRAGDASTARVFARNRPALLVGRHNPKALRSLADLDRPGVVFVACAPVVPCGRVAERSLAASGVHAKPASLEPDVKAVVAKVTLGEADAGIVYVSDARAAAGKADAVAIGGDVETAYPVALLRGARDRATATRFVEFVTSAEGRRLLAAHGFLAS
jgi:molybdate transport system substrate-binding protein